VKSNYKQSSVRLVFLNYYKNTQRSRHEENWEKIVMRYFILKECNHLLISDQLHTDQDRIIKGLKGLKAADLKIK